MKPRLLSTARLSFPLAAAFAALLAAPSASALTYYWDNDGTTAGFGTAAGTWAAPTTGSATQGWSTSTTGVLVPGSVTTFATDTVNFGNGATGLAAGTITASGTVNTGNMTFASGSGAIILTGGTISLASGSSINAFNNGGSINSAIALNGAGSIAYGNGVSGGAVGTLTVGGRISGGTDTTFTTSGASTGGNVQTINLNAANTYGGNTTITSNGFTSLIVRAGIANALPTGTVLSLVGTGNAGSGTSARVTTYNLNGFSQTLAGLTNTAGLVRRDQTVTNSGTLATLTINNTADYIFGGMVVSASGPSVTAVSRITGAIALVKGGAGTFTLTGADHTYSGATTINGGTLDLGGGAVDGSLSSTILNLGGGTFNYTRTGSTTQGFTTTNINAGAAQLSAVSGNILNLGTIARAAGGTLDFGSVGTGTVAALAASNDATGIMAGLTFGDTWAVANGADLAISGLAGASYTSTSAATSAAGYLDKHMEVDNSAGALDGPITAHSLRFNSAAANTVTLTGTTNTLTTGGILINSIVGTNLSTITGGELAGAASKDLSIIQNNTSGGLTLSSIIANNGGATGLAKSGAGLLTLSASNTFTGGLFVNGGQVLLNDAGALNSTAGSENAVTFAGNSNGILTMNGNSLVIRSLNSTVLSGSPVVENASGGPVTLTVGNAGNASGSFGGIIQDGTGGGALALTKAGSGTLTLAGNNSYSGVTAISAGKILASHNNALGSGTVTMGGSSAGLQLRLSSGVNINNDLIMNGGSTTGEGILSALGTATYSGDITINSNPLNGGGHLGAAGGEMLIRGMITSSVNVVHRIGNITYSSGGTGYTNMDVTGTAKVGALNGLATTATVAIGVSAAGTLDLNGFNQSLVGITKGPNAATIGNSSTTADSVLTTTGTSTFAGTIVNAISGGNKTVGLTLASGALTLSGNNTYTGTTTVSDGTLAITGGYLSLTTPINVASGAFFTTSRNNTFSGGGNGQPSGAWTIAGTLTQTANGSTMPLSVTLNNGTMSGSVAVSAFGTFLSNGGAGTTITANGASNAINAVGNVGLFTGLTVATPLVGDALAISSQLGGTSAKGGGLTKTGLGTVTLSSTSTYTGATTISGGTLVLGAGGSITTSTSVSLGAAGTLDTNAQATFTIPALQPVTIGIDPTGTGTSGKIAAAGLDITTAVVTLNPTATLDDPVYVLATYTGTLGGTQFAAPLPTLPSGYTLDYAYQGNKIALVASAANTYASWINGFFPAETNPLIVGANADPDNDGINNSVEMVIGGDPKLGMDTALMPTLELVTNPIGVPAGNYLLFTYRRTAVSELALVVASCETDTDLVGPWTPAVNTISGVVIQEDLNFTFTPAAPADTDRVRVYVPRGANTKLFGRLNVQVP